ncbi:MAG: DUF6132 family protein [Spirochaetia bacterium]|nr:DUF6132 family protein [Spirochaetia bacterium]
MAPVLIKAAYIIGGGGLGYLYYKFIGCRSGVCPLTSNPYGSILMGAVITFFIISK